MPASKLGPLSLFKSTKGKKKEKSTLWQKEQKGRKKRKSLRKIFFGFFIFGLLATLYSLNYYRAVLVHAYQPLPSNIEFSKNPDLNYRINLLVIGTHEQKELRDLVLVSYNHQDGELEWLRIPAGVYLNLPSDYGWGSLKSAFLLGQTEDNQKGVDVLVRGVETLLATPIDGYLVVDDPNVLLEKKTLENYRKSAWGPTFFFKFISVKNWLEDNLHTSLSPVSLAHLSFQAKNVRFDKTSYRDLTDFLITNKINDQEYAVLDYPSLDNYLKEAVAEPKILADLARIEVRNSTNKPGLATLASRVITNLGGNVVYVTNGETPLEETQIITYGKKEATAHRLGEVLGASTENKRPDTGVRGDIVVEVGLDFFNKLRLK